MLFALGGVAFQHALRSVSRVAVNTAAALIVAPCLLFIPVVIPVLPINTTLSFFKLAMNSGITFPLKWEDQRLHATTQDFGDMFGWQEMAKYSMQAYQLIPENERHLTTVIADNYGQAGALDHLGKTVLPKTVCLNSSFSLWAPDSIQTNHLIYVDDDISDLIPVYKQIRLVGEIKDPLAREKGTKIFLLSYPTGDINKLYHAARRRENQ